MKYIQKNKKLNIIANFRQSILLTLMGLLFVGVTACGDKMLDTSKSASNQNNEFKLILTISDDIVRTDDTIKITAVVERLVPSDSIAAFSVIYKMKVAAIGGYIFLHSAGDDETEISVKLDKAQGSTFESLLFFDPKSSDSSGNVTVSFDGMNVSMSIDIVEPR
jgi:hypothetical protein